MILTRLLMSVADYFKLNSESFTFLIPAKVAVVIRSVASVCVFVILLKVRFLVCRYIFKRQMLSSYRACKLFNIRLYATLF